jgi:hypothetical protein
VGEKCNDGNVNTANTIGIGFGERGRGGGGMDGLRERKKDGVRKGIRDAII